ncbi:hypothetical protein [Microbispora sp. H13382]|uniref:hypothetical protein n=1 Tax=Microbispora sp. H13382 TaxID=2729112 RepID=UPI0016027C91|nr:hypothetical protein [Microbispora sp. H13382]
MNDRDGNGLDPIKAIVGRIRTADGGKMNGKSVVAMVVVGLVVLAGFVAYRLLAFELIANLRRH